MAKNRDNIEKSYLDSGTLTVSGVPITLAGYIAEGGATFSPGVMVEKVKAGNAQGNIQTLYLGMEPKIEFVGLEKPFDLFVSLLKMCGNADSPNFVTGTFSGTVMVGGTSKTLTGSVQVVSDGLKLGMDIAKRSEQPVALEFVEVNGVMFTLDSVEYPYVPAA